MSSLSSPSCCCRRRLRRSYRPALALVVFVVVVVVLVVVLVVVVVVVVFFVVVVVAVPVDEITNCVFLWRPKRETNIAFAFFLLAFLLVVFSPFPFPRLAFDC